MDTVTARDYIHTYPTINKILTDYYPKPRHGFSEEDIYTILEEGLRVRDSRILKLETAIRASLEAMSDSSYGDRAITGKTRAALLDALTL